MEVEIRGKVVDSGFVTNRKDESKQDFWIMVLQRRGIDQPATAGKLFVAASLAPVSVGEEIHLRGELSWTRRDGTCGLYRAERVGGAVSGNGVKGPGQAAAVVTGSVR
jgi:hypothetical protein